MRWALGLLLLGCQGAPSASPAWRRSVDLLGVGDDGSLVELSLTVGNTGVLRGQGHARFGQWARGAAPIVYARDVHPDAVELDPHGAWLSLAADRVDLPAAGPIDARVANIEVNARLRLERSGTEVAAAAWQEGGGQWTTRVVEPGGPLRVWTTAGERAVELDGYGLLLDRGGDGRPALPRKGIYVLGDGVRIGVDRHGAGRLTWASLDGRDLDLRDLQLSWHTAQPIVIDLRPAEDVVVEIKRTRPRAKREPWSHLGSWERWLARRFWEEPERSIRTGRARLMVGGATRQVGAIVVEVTARR